MCKRREKRKEKEGEDDMSACGGVGWVVKLKQNKNRKRLTLCM